METRLCIICNIEKPADSFYKEAKRQDGSTCVRKVCKQCWNDRKTIQREKLRQYLAGVKKTSHCADCGMSDYRCLQFHHLGKKKDNVSDMVNGAVAFDTLKAEITKCIPLCANCHQIRHYNERIGQ